MDEFDQWLQRIESLLEITDSALGFANGIRTPPPSGDPAERAETLTSLWMRCQFRVPTDGDPAPWDTQVGMAAARLKDFPEQFYRKLFYALEPALGAALKEAGDPQSRLISTHGLPVSYLEVAVGSPLRNTWCVVELAQLPPDHLVRAVLPKGSGYRIGAGPTLREVAFLGIGQVRPSKGLMAWQPPAFTPLADVQRWTAIARRQQDTEQAERERQERQRLEQAERDRKALVMPETRIAALEEEVARLRGQLAGNAAPVSK